MKHLFTNFDGELVAADSPEQASQYHDVDLGGQPLNPEEWEQVDDDHEVPIWFDRPSGEIETEVKRAIDWASQYSEPQLVASTNV